MEYFQLEVFNDYKTLKFVEGNINITCDRADYKRTVSPLKFLGGEEYLPEGDNDFLLTPDENFVSLVKNSKGPCANAVIYSTEYKRVNDSNESELQSVTSFELFLDDLGNILDMRKSDSTQFSRQNFCVNCEVQIELNANNLRKPIKEYENYLYTISTHNFLFPEYRTWSNGLTEETSFMFFDFPYGFPNYCKEGKETCSKLLCYQLQNKYNLFEIDCEQGNLDADGLLYKESLCQPYYVD